MNLDNSLNNAPDQTDSFISSDTELDPTDISFKNINTKNLKTSY